MAKRRTVVVGGGISGLTLGYLLAVQGEAVTVLEAARTAGGNIATREEGGFLTEDGPNAFLDRDPLFRRLLHSLELEPKVREASAASRGRYVARNGQLRKVSPAALFMPGLLSWRGKLRLLAEPFSARGTQDDETLASFFTRHLGKEATQAVVDAVQTGIFAGDSDRLSVRATFPSLVTLEQQHRSLLWGMVRRPRPAPSEEPVTRKLCTFDGGMAVLPRALVTALGSALKLSAKVLEVQPAQHGFRLRMEGDALPQEAERVVFATPAPITAELTRRLDEPLATELVQIPYAPVSVVHLGFPATAEAASRAQGFGFLAPELEKLDVLGVIYASSVFPFRAPAQSTLFTTLVGGARHPEKAALSDETLVQSVRSTLDTFLGLRHAPSLARVVRWPRAIPQYNVGHAARWSRIQERLAAKPGLFLVGNAYQGVGILDCVRMATELSERLLRS